MNYKNLTFGVVSGFRRGVDFVLPPRCPKTGRIVVRNGDLSTEAWRELTFISDPKCVCCGLPFEIIDMGDFESSPSFLCGECLETPKVYGRARAALAYNDASRDLILAFKHGDQTHLAVTLVAMLYKSGEGLFEHADIIVPVPLHWFRLLRRRYNQAALLARGLAGLTGVSFRSDLLARTKHTAPQGHKSNKDRHANVKGVFAISPQRGPEISGKKIVLVDDVYTTGATVEECAKVLLAAGAASVDVLTVARVVKSH